MKLIKKFLSLFIEKVYEGAVFHYGFSYLFRNGWYNDEDFDERTIIFTFPLPVNRYGKYIAYSMLDIIVEGERWFTIVIGFRYMRIGKKRIFKPLFHHFWMPIGNTKVINTTYDMFLKDRLPKWE